MKKTKSLYHGRRFPAVVTSSVNRADPFIDIATTEKPRRKCAALCYGACRHMKKKATLLYSRTEPSTRMAPFSKCASRDYVSMRPA
ncbi:hypothetical protein [Paraburkholderia piptadeniae]|uniref:hypothetical protein n=1 Tax=Paraburkholderia piptadeniae TaxID=1701573 RepID=UPI001396678A|nr:hypothetical protein [Paraburkholderia piptadeniae]